MAPVSGSEWITNDTCYLKILFSIFLRVYTYMRSLSSSFFLHPQRKKMVNGISLFFLSYYIVLNQADTFHANDATISDFGSKNR